MSNLASLASMTVVVAASAALFVVGCVTSQAPSKEAANETDRADSRVQGAYEWNSPGLHDLPIASACAGPCPSLATVEKGIAEDPHWRRCLVYSDSYSMQPPDQALLQRGHCGDLRYISTSVTYVAIVDWFDRNGKLIGEHFSSDVGHGNLGNVPSCNESEPEDALCYVPLTPDERSDPLRASWRATN